MTERVRISEIFGPTIQGEGPLIGRPTVFVRTAGCDYRCAWCDTLYAVLPEYRDEWTLMSPPQIMARVNELAGDSPVLISLSGGNPALHAVVVRRLQKVIDPLIERLADSDEVLVDGLPAEYRRCALAVIAALRLRRR